MFFFFKIQVSELNLLYRYTAVRLKSIGRSRPLRNESHHVVWLDYYSIFLLFILCFLYYKAIILLYLYLKYNTEEIQAHREIVKKEITC